MLVRGRPRVSYKEPLCTCGRPSPLLISGGGVVQRTHAPFSKKLNRRPLNRLQPIDTPVFCARRGRVCRGSCPGAWFILQVPGGGEIPGQATDGLIPRIAYMCRHDMGVVCLLTEKGTSAWSACHGQHNVCCIQHRDGELPTTGVPSALGGGPWAGTHVRFYTPF